LQSGHPVLNSQYLLYETQQAHYPSLNPGLVIAAVTWTPAHVLEVGWGVGMLTEG
ncbi:hypothetical protein C8J57DRAFT_1004033, partial [Mycena rebaudengoi]